MAIASPSPTQISPHPTPLRSPVNQRHTLLELWHLLSLDAPTVAALWTWFIASTCHISLPAAGIAAVFLAVWMLYAADRLLDARQLTINPLHTSGLEARHLFHHRHANAFLTGIALAAIALSALLRHLLLHALELYAILGALLFVWLVLVHVHSSHHRLPKEVAVGIFFPAATFIPTVARFPQIRLEMLPHAAILAVVCSLNCLFIHAWEHPEPRSAAHWSTYYATGHLTPLAIATTIAGVALAVIDRHTVLWPLALAASLGAFNLLVLHRARRRISRLSLRAAADFALLTPLLFIAWSLV